MASAELITPKLYRHAIASRVMKNALETKDVLARNLEFLVEVRGWKQKEVARRSGLTQTTISNIMNATKAATVDTIDRLAGAFGLAPWHLLMPTLREDFESGGRIEKLCDRYFQSSDRGREHIYNVAEREAEYNSVIEPRKMMSLRPDESNNYPAGGS